MHIYNLGGDKRTSTQEAVQLATEAQLLFRKNGNETGEAFTLHVLAGAHALRDSMDNAFKAAQAASAIFRKLGLRILDAIELQSIASFFLSMGLPDEAVG